MSQIKYYHNGDIMEEYIDLIKVTYYLGHRINEVIYFNEHNRMHREDDKPAYLKFDQAGNIVIKIYYLEGKCHRDNDKPAFIKYQYILVSSNNFRHNNKLNNKLENKFKRYKKYTKELKYFIHGNIMRIRDEPTHIIYYKGSSQIKYAKYKSHLYATYSCFNHNLPMNIIVDNYLIHRSPKCNGEGALATEPGLIKYNRDGSICLEIYYHKGKIHRWEGPAKIMYSKNQPHELNFINNKLVLDDQDRIKQWIKMFASNLN